MINDDLDPDRQRREVRAWRSLAAGMFLTPIALFIAIISHLWGDFDYVAARVLFPIPMLIAGDTSFGIRFAAMMFGFLQYPIYGGALCYAIWSSRQAFRLALVWLCCLHFFAVAVGFRKSLLPWI